MRWVSSFFFTELPRLFAASHHAIDEFCYQGAVINRIRQHFASLCNSSSWHSFKSDHRPWTMNDGVGVYGRTIPRLSYIDYFLPAPAFGRFAPYFERPCF